jgi:Spy/CpxP family protein refolding chaperone
MKKRYTIAAVLTTLVLATVPTIDARPMRHHGGGEFGFLFGRLEKAKQRLALSDEQVATLEAIAQDLHAQNAPYRDRMRGGLGAVATTLLNNPNDVAAAQALLDQQSQAEKTMRSNVLQAASKAIRVLTPEQRGNVARFLAERKTRRAER